MDFSNDILMTDPFLTLDTDLEDVSAVIRNNMSEQPGILDSSPTPSPEFRHDSDFRADFKLSPSDPQKERDIGHIVSLLQDDMALNNFGNSRYMEPYGFNEGFNHFDNVPQTNGLSNGYHHHHHVSAPNLARLQQFQQLPTTNPVLTQQPTPQGYQPTYQRLNSTPVQYASQGIDQQLYVTTNFYDPHQQIVPSTSSYVSPAQATGMNSMQFQVQNGSSQNPLPNNYPLDGELKIGQPLDGDQQTLTPSLSPTATTTPTSSSSVNNSKKELIRMLLEMTPSEFENLRAGKGRESLLRSKARNSDTALSSRAKPSGVATKMTKLGPISPVSAIDPMDTGIPLPVSRQFSSPLVSPALLSTHSVEWKEDESETETDFAPPSRKAPKTERRTAHNLIEKKYRCSINDRIVLLKDMLAPEEVKLSKSATLRKAIDEINNLRTLNVQLAQENETLRCALRAAGIDVSSSVDLSRVKHEPSHNGHNPNRDGSTSPHSSTSSNASTTSNVSRSNNKRPRQMLDQSRVTLCVFMCVMVAFNPVAFFLSSGHTAQAVHAAAASQPDHHHISINEHHQHAAHRTLMANTDPFEDVEKAAWYQAAMIRHGFIWLLNAFIVVYVLTRLLVYGEPVADKRSPAWHSFLATKKYASFAISAGNYKEAQRQLYDSLQILDRSVPHPGGFDELMSVVWQIIRHILNGLWIGRWFARMRRSATQPVPVVCRSHATTALVYHQLHQLHLIGVDGIDSGDLCGLNLALSAVNLAESAGISNDGITHKQRADIYINAALRVKLSLPKFLGSILFAYFLRRARRHVRKAISTEGGDLHSIQWIFHPLANKFFSDRELLKSVLQNGKQLTNFPFSNNYSSPKPLDRLICSFKMHLLTLLVSKLSSTNGDVKVADFVEISHLLLNISTTDTVNKMASEDSSMNEWDTVAAGQGDELCTWWTHLITCGLYWKFGDTTRAQTHYSLVRKCPSNLLNNDLALAAGLAFCTRKMCYDDKTKKDFPDMAWVHTYKSFGHLKKSMLPHPGKTSNLAVALHKAMELVAFEWLLVSLLDIWQSTLTDRPYWEQNAAAPMRKMYHEVLSRYRNIAGDEESNKIATFKLFGRVLNGANPLTTWQMLKKQNVDLSTKTSSSSIIKTPPSKNRDFLGDYHYNLEVFQRIQRDLSNMCNIRRT